MDWNDLRYFLALARSGSIRSAGAALGVSHSTVVRRIEAFEEQLSTRLFDRSRDGFALTDAGREMLPGAERVEAEMSALERGIFGQDDRLEGTVAITCCDNYVSKLLMPGLARLCVEYPGVELSFNTDSRPFDLSKREADIAIRTLAIGSMPPEYLIGQKLAPVTGANYIAIEHAERLRPDAPDTSARWISFDDRGIHNMLIAQSSYAQLPPWGYFTSLELLTQAALAGMGIVMLPTYVGDAEPGLRRLDADDAQHLADLWLLYHPDLRDNARVRTVRSCVSDVFRDEQALFRGDARCERAPG